MDIKLTMENLNKNGINTFFVEKKSDVIGKIKEIVKEGSSVALGGSTSLVECGVPNYLRDGNYKFLGHSSNDVTNGKASYADYFFCSSNAVTQTGVLFNCDGHSNRISAIAQGPEKVIMVVGINKIVKDLDEAVYRLKTVAAPKNCVRLNKNTYCKENGKCESLLLEKPMMSDGCSGPDRICCNYLVCSHQEIKGRINVIFVNESIGF